MGIIRKNPELIHQPNVVGQTPLHFSVTWPASIQPLLAAGAVVDVQDNAGLTPIFHAATLCLHESFDILAGKNCSIFSGLRLPGEGGRSASAPVSLLKVMVQLDYVKEFFPSSYNISMENIQSMVDAVIELVVQRCHELEALARTLLNAEEVEHLQMSPGTVLDHKAPLAVSMLRERIDVPSWLMELSLLDCTVYHIRCLNVRQAHVLWHNGFRDVNELDHLGRSPLMTCRPQNLWGFEDLEAYLNLVRWFIGHGADLHCREKYQYQETKTHLCHISCDQWDYYLRLDEVSSTRAIHYLAGHLGRATLYTPTALQQLQSVPQDFFGISKGHWQFIEAILIDTSSDCCNCACSTNGCRPYTMWVKHVKMFGWDHIKPPETKLSAHTRCFPRMLHVDQPRLAWLRREMIRFNTFRELGLRHTCCKLEDDWTYENLIYMPYDDEVISEIQEEQAEQLQKLEALLIEFDEKYDESTTSFIDFFDGYWNDRMAQVTSEEHPIDHDALQNLGIRLRKDGDASSARSEDDVEEVEKDSDDLSEMDEPEGLPEVSSVEKGRE